MACVTYLTCIRNLLVCSALLAFGATASLAQEQAKDDSKQEAGKQDEKKEEKKKDEKEEVGKKGEKKEEKVEKENKESSKSTGLKLVPLEEMKEGEEKPAGQEASKPKQAEENKAEEKQAEEKQAEEKQAEQGEPEVTFGPKSEVPEKAEEKPAQGPEAQERVEKAEEKAEQPVGEKAVEEAAGSIALPGGIELLAAGDLVAGVSSGNADNGIWLPDVELAARGDLGKHASVYFRLNVHPMSNPGLLRTLADDYDGMDGKTETLEWDRFALNEAWVEVHGLFYNERLKVGRMASIIGRHNARSFYRNDFVEQPLLYDAFFGGAAFDNGLNLGVDIPVSPGVELAADFEVMSGDDFRPFDGSLRNSNYMVDHPDIRGFNKRPDQGDLVYSGRFKADVETGDLDLDAALAFATGAWDSYGDLSTFFSAGAGMTWHTRGRSEKSELAAEVEYMFNYSQLHGFRSSDGKVVEGDVYRGGGLYGQVVYRHEGFLEGGIRFDYLGLPHQEKGYGFPDTRTIRTAVMAGVRPVDQVLLKLQYSAVVPKTGDTVHTGFFEAQFGFGWL